jgi:hypothetical protein
MGVRDKKTGTTENKNKRHDKKKKVMLLSFLTVYPNEIVARRGPLLS